MQNKEELFLVIQTRIKILYSKSFFSKGLRKISVYMCKLISLVKRLGFQGKMNFNPDTNQQVQHPIFN